MQLYIMSINYRFQLILKSMCHTRLIVPMNDEKCFNNKDIWSMMNSVLIVPMNEEYDGAVQPNQFHFLFLVKKLLISQPPNFVKFYKQHGKHRQVFSANGPSYGILSLQNFYQTLSLFSHLTPFFYKKK